MEKVTFTTKELCEKIDPLMKVIPSKPIIPILNNLVFIFEDHKTSICASDLQSIMSIEIEMENNFNCKIAIPAKIFAETIKKINEDKITFEINDKDLQICIKTNNGEYLINGEDTKGFPSFEMGEKKTKFEFNSKTIKKELEKTISVVGQENLKPVLNGVFFDFKDENQRSLIATDIHRLIQIDLNATEEENEKSSKAEENHNTTQESSFCKDEDISTDETLSFILSKKTSQILISILPEDEKIQLEVNDKFFCIKVKDIFFISNIIQGKYPDYKNAFPQNNPNILTVKRNKLLDSLKRILSFTNTLSYKIKIEIKENDNRIHITGENENFDNKAEEYIECSYEGENITILYNVKYVIEMLENMTSEDVVFFLSKANERGFSYQASLIKEKGGNAFSGLIMPMIE